MPPRIEQMTAAPGEYRQVHPSDPAPELVAELAYFLGCEPATAAVILEGLRVKHG